ncbi:hypothetical protein L7F22_033647 [Adiantum nelumboides]|nr:hypothetical protein [Adiantum nelumboides]
MICSSPPITPDAKLALLPATSKDFSNTCIPSTVNFSQWRPIKSDTTISLLTVKEQRGCCTQQELETPLNAEDNFCATGVAIKANKAIASYHAVPTGEADELKVEVTLIEEGNHPQAGAAKDVTLGSLLKTCSERRDLLRELNHADADAYVCVSNFTRSKRLVKTIR